MSMNIRVANFEGPFDLLLHLIKKNQMDIYNIKIYEITNQYL
jgi:segregation and condensation protein A